MSQATPQRTALVTGANGYIGNAVAKAFARADWKTYGLIRCAEVLARSYGLTLAFMQPGPDRQDWERYHLFEFWQWVGSDRIRTTTGWQERRATFVNGIGQYRLAYEASQ